METDQITISDLVEKCKVNDREAQLQLYKRYCDGMFAVACRYMRSQADAEDALQDAFIKAFQKIRQFKGEVSFGAWLKKIVINRCLDLLRQHKYEFVGIPEDDLTEETDTDWQVHEGIRKEDVCYQLLELPTKYREVLQLFLLEGYDHEEIGEILGISQSNCRTRLMRGRRMLIKKLKRNYVTGS